ncbi:MAG: carbamoyltransferase HypF [Candidatus Melainabacteria bacterium]|nr:carbamoyltransferase HypF [Candidatus Melainabacteria bacterium]
MISEIKKETMTADIVVTGTVQGVGFRPFVYRLARELGLRGTVKNAGGSVEISVAGSRQAIDSFMDRLRSDAPDAAVVDRVWPVHYREGDLEDEGFAIETSEGRDDSRLEISPDIATCDQCLTELLDKADRRYRYPFINCTNCGPRFTIIHKLPYDRASTVMDRFAMCDLCQAEFLDPGDRRFHAQPNACARCGPSLSFRLTGGELVTKGDDALENAELLLIDGGILALKGLGGFHLACLATDEAAVSRLRERKHREEKPLAVMMPDLTTCQRYCHLDRDEIRALTGAQRPIVLLRIKEGAGLPDCVAPGLDELGVMLPYTPLHHLLSRDLDSPLVMTSGNLSEEPIATGNAEAIERLSVIADGFLLHDRDIESRYDDSVSRVMLGANRLIRRARGYAPAPLRLDFYINEHVLALGGHLKNTFCVIDGNRAYLSQHIGDLDNLESREHLRETLVSYQRLFELSPEILAFDMHPDYATSNLFELWSGSTEEAPIDMASIEDMVAVQHHHAHIAACMVEYKLTDPVIGIAFDGIGYGEDGNFWGGEFLKCDYRSYERLAHIDYLPMPGAMTAVREPWRMALSALWQCDRVRARQFGEKLVERIPGIEVDLPFAFEQLENRTDLTLTSSCGRLFDAVASLLGISDCNAYEGQSAMLLEAAARRSTAGEDILPLDFEIEEVDGLSRISLAPALSQIYRLHTGGSSALDLAYRFHYTIAVIMTETALKLREGYGLNQVCMSGGVFQNRILTTTAEKMLRRQGFDVFLPARVPVNDGGLSLGQAVVALAQLSKI